MKSLRILGFLFLLFAIWLNTYPQRHSNVPELLSSLFALSGLAIGVISLLGKEN